MHWVLQSNLFHEAGWQVMVDTLDRFEIPYSIHKVIPFVGELEPDIELTGNVVCFGAYSMRKTAQIKNWKPGVFDLEPYDFNVQLSHWGNHMLNSDSVVSRFEDVDFVDEQMFMRPINDSKFFSGGVFEKDAFISWRRNVCVLEFDYGDSLTKDTLVQVCSLKNIHAEYRFWIVAGKIVTASTYRFAGKILYRSEVDQIYHDFVEQRIAEYQPHNAFVIDVCDTDDGIKIVEINTMNAAGFYAGDVQKLVIALETAYQ